MCGIVALYASGPVNQRLYDALLLLQHRGQDAAGICTVEGRHFHMHKAMGLVRDVFRTRNMRDLLGNCGIGQVRYPTQGNATAADESQPFYVNAPFGIVLAHNGNLTNAEELAQELYELDRRHINTTSDSEVLLNVFANELALATQGHPLDEEALFKAVAGVHKRVKGSYAVVCMIAGHGVVAFRDPYGIRPPVNPSHSKAANSRFWAMSIRVKRFGLMRTESCIKNSALSIRFIRLVFSNTFILLVPTLSLTEFPFTRLVCDSAKTLLKKSKRRFLWKTSMSSCRFPILPVRLQLS